MMPMKRLRIVNVQWRAPFRHERGVGDEVAAGDFDVVDLFVWVAHSRLSLFGGSQDFAGSDWVKASARSSQAASASASAQLVGST